MKKVFALFLFALSMNTFAGNNDYCASTAGVAAVGIHKINTNVKKINYEKDVTVTGWRSSSDMFTVTINSKNYVVATVAIDGDCKIVSVTPFVSEL
ncbi:MAG: hypothetical protein PHY93_18175 [Bacteriovorax sp.]|nr:hypothetical protein [Bacteriovorax sp.]